MKVLLVTSAYPSSQDQWRGIIIASLAQALAEKGIDVNVVVPQSVGSNPYSYYKGVHIWKYHYFLPHSLEILSEGPGLYYQFHNNFIAKIQLPLLLACEIFTLLILIKRIKPDVLHTNWIIPHGLIGAIIHRITGIPHIISIHGSDINLIARKNQFTFILPFIKRNSLCITTNSIFTRDKTRTLNVFKKMRIEVIPMGMGNSSFFINTYSPENGSSHKNLNRALSGAPGEPDGKYIFVQKKKTILFVGRLIVLKGVNILIKAYAKVIREIPHSQLIIIGDGPEYSNLLTCAKESGVDDHIQFRGTVFDTDLHSCYQGADLLVLPTNPTDGQTEGLGVVLLEAMASGVPVIGSNTGGIPDIIEDNVNGLLVPPGDPDALAVAIIRILEDPDLAEQFRKAGLYTVNGKFSWNQITEQFIELYQQVLTKSHGA